MARYLKRGLGEAAIKGADAEVRRVVEDALDDIARRGDDAVRDMSRKFDGFERDDFRLAPAEIAACLESLEPQARSDIEFAQAQVRNFAEIQKAASVDPDSTSTFTWASLSENPLCGSAPCRSSRH